MILPLQVGEFANVPQYILLVKTVTQIFAQLRVPGPSITSLTQLLH